MKLYAENETGAAELEVERKPPMPEAHFRALCHIAYALIGTAGEVAALYLVGEIALASLIPAGIVALIVAIEKS